jgi:hypothetical protein
MNCLDFSSRQYKFHSLRTHHLHACFMAALTRSATGSPRHTHLHICSQGYFCDRICQNDVLEVLSQKDASWNGILEPLFPGIGLTNTTSLQLNFGLLFVFQNLIQKKNSTVCSHSSTLSLMFSKFLIVHCMSRILDQTDFVFLFCVTNLANHLINLEGFSMNEQVSLDSLKILPKICSLEHPMLSFLQYPIMLSSSLERILTRTAQ